MIAIVTLCLRVVLTTCADDMELHFGVCSRPALCSQLGRTLFGASSSWRADVREGRRPHSTPGASVAQIGHVEDAFWQLALDILSHMAGSTLHSIPLPSALRSAMAQQVVYGSWDLASWVRWPRRTGNSVASMPRPAITIRILSGSSTQNAVTCGSALGARTAGLRVAAFHGPPAQHGDIIGASAPLHFGDWVEPLPLHLRDWLEPRYAQASSDAECSPAAERHHARHHDAAAERRRRQRDRAGFRLACSQPVWCCDGPATGWWSTGLPSRPRGTWHNRSVCTWSDCQHEALNYMSFHMQLLGASFRLMPGMVWGMAVAASTRP